MFRLLFLAAIYFSSNVASIAAKSVPAEPSGYIGGVVRNAWSKAPIRRAVVTLDTTGPRPMEAVAYSDNNGAFGFSGVPAGSYYICARFRGYGRACYGGANEPGRPVPELTLTNGEARRDVLLAMLPEGSVSGTVVDGDGDPVANAQVQLLRPVYERRTLHWRPGPTTSTNDRGEYHVSFVIPGDYRVLATRAYQIATRIQPDVTNGQKQPDEVYAVQFYPGASSIDAAASLTLSAGADLKGIDFTLETVPQVIVSGKVEVPEELREAGAITVTLVPVSSAVRSEQTTSVASAPEYRFSLNTVPGKYRLVATSRGDADYRTVQTVEVGATPEDITVKLTPGAPLAGKLQLEGAGAKEAGPYRIELVSGDDIPLQGEPPSADVAADGAFEFDSVVPGIWDINVSPLPEGAYIKSMRLGQQDVLTEDMELKTGTRAPLNIVLSMNGATVTGNVLEPSSAETPNASPSSKTPRHDGRVMVLLAPEGKWENVLSFYQLVASDSHGHYQFKSVTPGKYRVFAFDEMQGQEYWKPGFLTPFQGAGTALEAGEGARVQTDTTLIRRAPEGVALEGASQ
jgi:hypothetical protein